MRVDLEHAELIGKGSSRLCYVHPEDPGKCVKVIYTNNTRVADEELSYYNRFSRRRISWDMMSITYGYVRTTLGKGVVFSLSRDYDGLSPELWNIICRMVLLRRICLPGH